MRLDDPMGFGATDYLEITLALLLLGFVFARPFIVPLAGRLAKQTLWCMLALAALPVVLRVALLPHHPVPTADIYDEFGHLFTAGTLAHFHLANPMHPMHRFLETFFILQEPTHSSIYPLGQGLMLALGSLLGLPWMGVVLATGALCALSYWMLRGWVSPEWALAGGLLAVMEFGPLNGWMNGYWGGTLAACAGCLVFGALPRMVDGGHWRNGAVLGLGLAVHLLTRPFESILLLLSVVLFFVWARSFPRRPIAIAFALLGVGAGLTLLQNRSVTGTWLTTPYQLSQYQYGVPVGLTFQTNAVPHRELTPQQAMEYRSQLAFRNSRTETLGSYLERLEYRARYYRFFLLTPLYVALVAYLFASRSPRRLWVLSTLAIFALGSNFYAFFQVHFIAAVTCLFLLISVEGLRRLSEWRLSRPIAWLVIFFCIAQFLLWYALHLFEDNRISLAMERYETWDSIDHGNPARRIFVSKELAGTPGQLLVFVRYSPQHMFQEEWVYNEPDIDAARIVWARDRGAVEDAELIRYYPRRSVWLLEPDSQPPHLSPYQPETEPSIEARGAPQPEPVTKKPATKPTHPTLRFEDVK